MAYNRINWQNGVTPINDTNLNIMDLGIYELDQNKQDKLIGSGTGQNIKTINNIDVMGTGNISVQPVLVGSGTGQNIKTINNINVMGTGNININQIVGAALSLQTETITLSAYAAQEARFNLTKNLTIASGYKVIGIIGWNMSGGGFTNLSIPEFYVDSNNILHYSVCNNTNNITADVTFSVYILLSKTT